MTKVRVYELAKELNMESIKLVEDLVAGGMSIKNYMATLDEESVAQAKKIVSGAVSEEVIEEKRVKPRIIRRRKKAVEPEIPLVQPEEAAKPPEALEEIREIEEIEEIEEVPVPKGVQGIDLSAGKEVAQPDGTKQEPVDGLEKALPIDIVKRETEVPDKKEVKPVAETKGKAKKTKKRKIDRPARIVKLPEKKPAGEVVTGRAKKKKPDTVLKPAAPVRTSRAGIKEISEKPKKAKPGKRKVNREKAGKASEGKGLFRKKKEIYEKSDLYKGRGLKRKIRRDGKNTKGIAKGGAHTEITVPKAIKRRIKVQEFVTVAELAKAMGIKAAELIKKLMSIGFTGDINKSIDFETASLVADDFSYELELDTFEEKHPIIEEEDKPEDLSPRSPVVTIMGHVDHGKTSLLDYIRESNIIGGESGGITQHIGAYYVKTEGGDITFLDTPGHEAFTAMRARGSRVTDLIVLVVAADDGAMPQTKEAINHARAAHIPIVVAVNKIDKPEADPEKVKRSLADLGLAPEEWGGDTLYAHVSAKTGEGIKDLLNLISLQSEMLELKGNANKRAKGNVIEARLDKSKGPLATVLIRDGSLKQGEYFVCGEHYGRVRAMLNHSGKKVKLAGPSMPVEIYGISGVPMAGDHLVVVEDEKQAKQIAEHRMEKARKPEAAKRDVVSLEDLFDKMKQGEVKELDIVLKTDVQGSLEAVGDTLVNQSTEEVKLKVIHAATGAITESDVMLAFTSSAIIIGFNVRTNQRVTELAEKENVDIRYYDVIYDVVKDIRLAMTGLLEPVYKEKVIGRAEIKEIFKVPKIGAVAGCLVSDGVIERNANVRLLRDDVVVFDSRISSLRRFKEDVKVVQSGYECGIGMENYNDIKPGDVFEVYQNEELQAEL